jgi:8-oxo-dGTP pyrophosphatase MutT (NUDIX family)
MQTSLTLTEKDVYPDNVITLEENYIEPRSTTRVVIFDENNNVALEVFTGNDGDLVYCMIGGGIDEGESVEQALAREAREEAGCILKNIEELGIIEERGIGNKVGDRCVQTNYCFIAEVDGEKRKSTFTNEELARGYHCVWLPLDDAITKLRAQHIGFMTRRTLFLLEEAKRVKGL